MKDFKIKVEKKDKKGIICRFYSEVSTKLVIEDIKYFYSLKEKDYPEFKGIIPIFLNNNYKLELFEFPYANKEYTSITFLIKEKAERENIFAVRIDLKNDKIEIKDI